MSTILFTAFSCFYNHKINVLGISKKIIWVSSYISIKITQNNPELNDPTAFEHFKLIVLQLVGYSIVLSIKSEYMFGKVTLWLLNN